MCNDSQRVLCTQRHRRQCTQAPSWKNRKLFLTQSQWQSNPHHWNCSPVHQTTTGNKSASYFEHYRAPPPLRLKKSFRIQNKLEYNDARYRLQPQQKTGNNHRTFLIVTCSLMLDDLAKVCCCDPYVLVITLYDVLSHSQCVPKYTVCPCTKVVRHITACLDKIRVSQMCHVLYLIIIITILIWHPIAGRVTIQGAHSCM